MTEKDFTLLPRYSRQVVLREIGVEGQRKLSVSRIVVVGMGATGSVSSAILVRAGIGRLLVVDRDVVESSNLQRQVLYTEEDVTEGLPKAIAAARRLSSMNKDVEVEAVNDHLSPRNIGTIIGGFDVVIDGTDNMETRFLINDYCIRHNVPWVYGGALGTGGMAMVIHPGKGPCLHCLFPEAPVPGSLGTCETVGVLGSAPAVVGSYQAMAAIRHIVTGGEHSGEKLLAFDLWSEDYSAVTVKRSPDCPTCGRNEFPYLEEEIKTTVVTMCGEGTYLVYPPSPRPLDLSERAETLEGWGETVMKGHYLVFRTGSREMIVFSDGRAHVKGMRDPAEALKFYTQFVGM